LKRFYSNTLPLLLDIDSRHAIKALRCKENDVIEVIDGKGKLFEATIFSIQRNEIQLIDLKLIQEEKENKQVLSIAIAPTKNPARLEWFVEKATEIGIKHIYPIISKRSEKINVKMDRLQNIIVAATKQSKQLHLPTLHQIVALETFVQDKKLPTQKYIAHCEAIEQKKSKSSLSKKRRSACFNWTRRRFYYGRNRPVSKRKFCAYTFRKQHTTYRNCRHLCLCFT
jgi:16S rRNA (uracil1498-N3)-methyltransferase